MSRERSHGNWGSGPAPEGDSASDASGTCRAAIRLARRRRSSRTRPVGGRAAPCATLSAMATVTRPAALERYEAVIGIEVHCQLKTASKMFCGCSNSYDGAPPNTQVCPVCLGLPGALPTINKQAVEHVLLTGAAIEATAPAATRWD